MLITEMQLRLSAEGNEIPTDDLMFILRKAREAALLRGIKINGGFFHPKMELTDEQG